jgi:cation diffusion facilitator family transporter
MARENQPQNVAKRCRSLHSARAARFPNAQRPTPNAHPRSAGYTQPVSGVTLYTDRSLGPTGRRQVAAARLSLLSNLGLVAVKITAGVVSGSISVLAEGVQSSVDVVASALILVTLRTAAAPPDENHPYGHGKFENIASLGQMFLILGSAGYLLWAAWDRWWNPVMPRVDWGIAALCLALAVNAAVSAHLMRVARETGSQALEAEATHLRSDMLSCVGVLAGLAAVAVTRQARFDPAIAGVMTVVVVLSALRLLRDTLRPLLDESLPAGEAERVRAVLDADPRVLGYHRLRTRRAGAHRLIDVHILLDDQLTFAAAHLLAEEIEGKVREALPNSDIIIHAEPFEEETRHQAEVHGTGVPP